MTAYDPDTDITTYLASVTDLDTLVNAFIGTLDLTVASPTLPDEVSESDITSDVANLEAQLDSLKDDRLTGSVIPRFEAGMRDINAVVNSAFVIGRSMIESDADAEITRDVAAHGSKLRISVKPTDAQVGELNLRESELDLRNREFVAKSRQVELDFQRMLTQLVVEAYRLKIVAKKEETDLNNDYTMNDSRWDLEVFQYGANVMASPAGGTAVPSGKKATTGSVIGGALSGGAAGAAGGFMVGGPVGAAIGGVLGLGAGLAAGL